MKYTENIHVHMYLYSKMGMMWYTTVLVGEVKIRTWELISAPDQMQNTYICMIYINACILNPSDFLNLQRFVHIKPTFNVNHIFYHNENKGFFFFTYSFIVMHKN